MGVGGFQVIWSLLLDALADDFRFGCWFTSFCSTTTIMAQQIERNQEATVYIGNLDERCTDSLVWELMLQAGPVGTLDTVTCSKRC